MDNPSDDTRAGLKPGSVFQINESHGRAGWVGALLMADEVKAWGVQGFVAHVLSETEQQRAYIRLEWSEIEYVGQAPLVPSDEQTV